MKRTCETCAAWDCFSGSGCAQKSESYYNATGNCEFYDAKYYSFEFLWILEAIKKFIQLYDDYQGVPEAVSTAKQKDGK